MMATPKAKTSKETKLPKPGDPFPGNGALAHSGSKRVAVPCTGGCGDLTFDPEGLCVGCRRNSGQKIEPVAMRPRFDADEDATLMVEDQPASTPPARVHPVTGIQLCTGKNNTCENAAAGGVCWDCQQEAAAKAEPAPLPADQVKMIRSDVPMLRMEGGHFSDRLDGALTAGQVRNLRSVTDGLRAKMATLANGRPVVSGLDAVRWWLESLARTG